MEGLRDRMCKCKDTECGATVSREMKDLGVALVMSSDKDNDNPTSDVLARGSKIQAAYDACKAAIAAPNGAAPATNH